MDTILKMHPEVAAHLDSSEEFTNRTEEFVLNGVHYLRVTQVSEFEGGQSLFRMIDDRFEPVYADNVTDFRQLDVPVSLDVAKTVCGPSSDGDHQAVHQASVDAVDHFSSASGPDHGNLACVWAVRHIVHDTLGRWITKTDGTAVFAPELRQCFKAGLAEADVRAGGIVISPTVPGNIGHVGLLGPATGDDARLIYSNSSAAAMWKQNFTMRRWRDRYVSKKGLKMLFFPLPLREAAVA